MRVLQLGKFYPPHAGGMETYLESLCRLLRNRVELRVIVANESSGTVTAVVNGVSVTRLGTVFRFAGGYICPSLEENIRSSNADIVHIHLPNPWAALAYLRSGHRGKLIITYHSDVIKQRWLGKFIQPITRRLLNRSSAVISASRAYVESSEVLHSYRERCHVIPFGIRPEGFDREPDSRAEAIRKRFGEPIILSVGRLVYYKGLDYLLDAMKTVEGKLIVVGEGPLRPELTRRIAQSGLAGKIFLVGEVSDILPYYQAADIFVLASNARSEAFGIVQLEAMACGKPVINTDLNTGVPSVSLHGRTGLTVPPSNSDALAWAIRLLLSDPELRLRYGKAARERVRREFCLEEMVERTFQLYQLTTGIADNRLALGYTAS